ncbi:MAG: hypothetical protein ACJ786_20435 [Catenulispora sp.]
MSRITSRRIMVSAAAAASVALLASACGKSSPQPAATPATSAGTVPVAAPATPSGSASTPAGPQYAAGTALISDGSDTVTIGGTPVRFPTSVSEAAWSPDGSRVAFVDGSGNVATARPDGSSVVVLVKPDQGAKLSAPAWEGGVVLYTEQNAAGTHFVRQAQTTGQRDHSDHGELYVLGDAAHPDTPDLPDTSNPTAAVGKTVGVTITDLVFQTHGAKGPEVWFHETDSTARGGANPAQKLVDGSWPALSAAGGMAFVGTGGQIELLSAGSVRKMSTASPTKLADGTPSATHLAWTPDGKSVAYSTPTGIEEIPVGRPGAAPTQLSAKPGVVSFLPAGSDKIVPLSGTSPADLAGASIALSRHRYLTQTGTTAAPAGGGARGTFAMSVTIVAADDPATAQKELSWGGLYGPTLLTTGHGVIDPRLTAEIKRVLGTPLPGLSMTDGVDTDYLIGDPSAFPAATDAAIKALGYRPAHVEAAPEPRKSQAPTTIAIVDQGDTAAANEAKAEGCHVMTLADGKLSAADAMYINATDKDPQTDPPRIVAFGDKAYAVANALNLERFDLPSEALGTTHADFLAAIAAPGALVIAPDNSPADVLLANLSTTTHGHLRYDSSTVTIDPAQGVSPTLKALLDTGSASIDELDIVDTTGKLSADTVKQISALVGGPLGTPTVANQSLDDVAKAEKKQ